MHLRLIYHKSHDTELKRASLTSYAGVLHTRWDPLYDLYATTEDGKPSTSVSFHYRVNLSQRTGEDWTNAKLILSTSATDVLNAGIPSPDSLTAPIVPLSQLAQGAAVISKSPMTISYTVEALTTIPSDGVSTRCL